MDRRVCLVEVANNFLAAFEVLLPQSLVVTGRQELLTRDATILRLEGPTLPDFCAAPQDGGAFAWVVTRFDSDGKMRVIQVPEVHDSFIERLLESTNNPN